MGPFEVCTAHVVGSMSVDRLRTLVEEKVLAGIPCGMQTRITYFYAFWGVNLCLVWAR